MPLDLPPWTATALLVAGAISGVTWVVRTFGAGAGIGLLALAWTVLREIDIARGRRRLFAALERQFEALARDGARGLHTPAQNVDARSQSSIA